MSIFLLFGGMDLISHNLQHVLEDLGNHQAHRPHVHERASIGSVDIAAILGVMATLISAYGLKNHKRMGKALRLKSMSWLPSVLANPSHFLTLSCSGMLVILPLLSITLYIWLDRLLSITIAFSMVFLGYRLVKNLGFMLLMSYSGEGVAEVMKDIAADPAVTSIDESRFWQVHYGLCMANLKLRVRGSEDSFADVRERITRLVKTKLGGSYGSPRKWEVSTQLTLDNS
jgi:Co/Zn/Cd efflux system component